MRKSAPIEVVVHYPKTKDELGRPMTLLVKAAIPKKL